jgi:hypothetical protein
MSQAGASERDNGTAEDPTALPRRLPRTLDASKDDLERGPKALARIQKIA